MQMRRECGIRKIGRLAICLSAAKRGRRCSTRSPPNSTKNESRPRHTVAVLGAAFVVLQAVGSPADLPISRLGFHSASTSTSTQVSRVEAGASWQDRRPARAGEALRAVEATREAGGHSASVGRSTREPTSARSRSTSHCEAALFLRSNETSCFGGTADRSAALFQVAEELGEFLCHGSALNHECAERWASDEAKRFVGWQRCPRDSAHESFFRCALVGHVFPPLDRLGRTVARGGLTCGATPDPRPARSPVQTPAA